MNSTKKHTPGSQENRSHPAAAGVLQKQESDIPSPDALPPISPEYGLPPLPPLAPNYFGDEYNFGDPSSQINWFGMSQPFFNRGVPHLRMGENSGVYEQWMQTYQMGQYLGLGADTSSWLSNTLTPTAINSALKGDYPTMGEQISYELGSSPIMLPIPGVHFKLKVGEPDDPFEREADDMADRVMKMEKPSVQRKCKECEEEEEQLQMKPKVSQFTTSPGPMISLQTGLLDRLGSALGNILSDPFGFISNLVEAIITGIRALVTKLGEHVISALRESLLRIPAPVISSIQSVISFVQNLLDTLLQFILSNLEVLRGLVMRLVDFIVQTLNRIVSVVVQLGPRIQQLLQNFVQRVQRAISGGNTPAPSGENYISRKAQNGDSAQATPWIESQIKGSRGSGSSMPAESLSFMEEGFDVDFSRVKIHTGSRAAERNQQLGARAFTVGSDIYFNSGEFSPGSSEGKRLLAHELTHTLQQGNLPAKARKMPEQTFVQRKCRECEEEEKSLQPKLKPGISIQRSAASHDLTSTRLKGDPLLEDTYDGFEVVKPPMKGPAVGRIQNALLDLGFELKQFGVDEDYGSETSGEVRKYQTKAGLPFSQRDGKINSVTIGLMDRDLRQGTVGGDTHTTAGNKEIGKYFKSAEEPLMIFYSQGKWEIDAEERAKLKKAVGTHGKKAWTLRGFASDEGSDAANKALANKRAEQLSEVVINEFGFGNLIVFDTDAWEVGQGNINYAYFRSVKIVPEGLENKDFDKKCPPGGTKTGTCDSIDPTRETLFKSAHTAAVNFLTKAISAFPMTGKQVALFDELFDINNGDNKLRKEREKKVKDRLGQVKQHVSDMLKPDLHQCGTLCHPICQAGSPAFNRDKDITDPHTGKPVENAEGVMTICPAFKTFKKNELPIILIHEGHHGTPGFVSRDEAYNDTRALAILDFDRAMSNAGTFHVFVSQLNGISFKGSSIGPTFEDKFSRADKFTADEKSKANEGVAWPHQWLIRSGHILSAIYNYMDDVRKGKDNYANPEKAGLKDLIEDIAFDFPITRPPAKPKESDLVMLAAMADRVARMVSAFEDSPLEFSRSGSSGSSWEAGPGRKVSLSDLYFSSPLDQRLNIILQELVHATPNISAELEPAYVRMVHSIREGLGLGPS